MNKTKACKLLNLSTNDLNEQDIKKQFRMKALQYHPDKNKSPDSKQKFQEINDAYQYLMENNYHTVNDERNNNYENFLWNFLNQINQNTMQQDIWFFIINKLTSLCEDKVNDYLQTLTKTQLIKTYEILFKYKEYLNLSQDIFDALKQSIQEKLQQDEKIILNPTLSDLQNHNVYKLSIEEEIYFIPLWHKQLIYDHSGNELIIECIPTLEPSMTIDVFNHLHCAITLPIEKFIKERKQDIVIGNQTVTITGEEVTIVPSQVIIKKHIGIPIPNEKEPFNVSKLGDLYIHLTFVFP